MIKYKDKGSGDRVMIDLGLNVKNWSKRLHVPRYVRFITSQEKAVANQHDGMVHNAHSKGGKKTRSHWEYSAELVEILKEYKEKFPEVFVAAAKGRKSNSMPDLRDLFGAVDPKTIAKAKEITKWIEALPISSIPFVEMGFDSLDPETVETLNQRRNVIQNDYQNVNLKIKATEFMNSKVLYAERFPFWCPLFNDTYADMFKVGQRVMNINSTCRRYVPFGLRGTVVGRTDKKVIVLFDQQFL